MKMRTDLSALNDEDYLAYKRAFEAKKQKKWRRKMRKLGIPVASNMSVKQRKELYASR
jgi:hypothetical protein